VLERSSDDILGTFNSGLNEFIFVFGDSWRDWRGDMNYTFDSIHGVVPRVGIEEISLPEFKIFFGIREFIKEGILGLVRNRSDCSDDFVTSLEKLSDHVGCDVS
jgi:hypothetical protein